jgi:hypothetical protein
MTLIKILLLAAIVAIGLLAFRGSRRAIHKVLWRVYVVLVVLAACMSILFPDMLTKVAELVGVGRGADLLLYVLVVTFMLVSVVLFRRIAELERRYTQLARTIAVNSAARGNSHVQGDDA